MRSLLSKVVGLLGGKARGRVVSYSPLSFNHVDGAAVKSFVYEWNNSYPIDRWWREKHNIAFNSSQHREVSFLDMRTEWEEDLVYSRVSSRVDDYKINKGDFFKKEEDQTAHLSDEEQLQKFLEEEKDFDYSQYDKTVEEKKVQ